MKSMLRTVTNSIKGYYRKYYVFKPLNFFAAYFVLWFMSVGMDIIYQNEPGFSFLLALAFIPPAVVMATSHRTAD